MSMTVSSGMQFLYTGEVCIFSEVMKNSDFLTKIDVKYCLQLAPISFIVLVNCVFCRLEMHLKVKVKVKVDFIFCIMQLLVSQIIMAGFMWHHEYLGHIFSQFRIYVVCQDPDFIFFLLCAQHVLMLRANKEEKKQQTFAEYCIRV